MAQLSVNEEPRISVCQVSITHDREPGTWVVEWRVENTGLQPIRLSSVRLPHGQFKSEELCFVPAIDLQARELTNFEVLVRCDEPAGPVTENAFLIFQVSWRGTNWRIFVRVHVEVDPAGIPRAKVESVTTQRVGFSGISS